MIEITVSKDGELARVLRGEFFIAGVADDDSFSTAIVGRADNADIVATVCMLASRAAYEMADGDKKAGKEFLKIMEESLKTMRKSPELWHELQVVKEIEEWRA